MTFYITDYYESIPYNIVLSAFFIVGLIGIIGLTLYNWLFKSDFVIDFFDTAYKRVHEYFKGINKRDFYERGIEWFILPDLWWIEMRILSVD